MEIPRPVRAILILGKRSWSSTLRPLLDLKSDLDEKGTLEAVEKAIEFQGAGVWTLAFAILIASIGLNVNSTAVIIGAMLISPLMGPLVGAGVALGINHFSLFKQALRNILVATGVGIGASFFYFLLSPLGEAQSELLARTHPTIYDVLIAICGGATGIIAGTRKEKSFNAISGVAIATALMPPLCTAGFGLAKGQFTYFAGALYLYLINSIYICLSTFVVVTALGFKKHVFLDRETERKVTTYMTISAILVLVPSVYTGYRMVTDVLFQSKAKEFLTKNFTFSDTKIIEKNIFRDSEGKKIELSLIGKPLDTKQVEKLKSKLPLYGLEGTQLVINDAGSASLQEIESRLKQNLSVEFLQGKDEKIRVLELELLKYKKNDQLVKEVGEEVQTLNNKVIGISFADMPTWSKDQGIQTPTTVVLIRWKGKPAASDKTLVERFLKARLRCEACQFIH